MKVTQHKQQGTMCFALKPPTSPIPFFVPRQWLKAVAPGVKCPEHLLFPSESIMRAWFKVMQCFPLYTMRAEASVNKNSSTPQFLVHNHPSRSCVRPLGVCVSQCGTGSSDELWLCKENFSPVCPSWNSKRWVVNNAAKSSGWMLLCAQLCSCTWIKWHSINVVANCVML